MTPEELKSVLDAHAKWARGADGGKRADLRDADLQGAYLRGADLQGAYLQGADFQGAYLQRADLQGAYLQGAYLRDADLQGAYLQRADLQGAYLQGADFQGADFQGADLRGAYLQRAYLQRADLQGAYLQGAYLRGADLQGADLRGADLQGADLRGADLRGADLRDAKGGDLAIARTRILPAGDLIGWKKCREGRIVKLRIPVEAKRSHAFGRKCRSEYVEVLAIEGETEAKSIYDGTVTYRVGETVRCGAWDEDWMTECGGGIHWYITREEAEAHE